MSSVGVGEETKPGQQTSDGPAGRQVEKHRLLRRLQAGMNRDAVRIVAVAGLCLIIWILRRPEQLTRPYVWVEESFIIRNFLDDGWAGAFEPIQGYLILPSTVLVTLATDLSFVHLPELTYIFATLVFMATILLLLVPESHWGDLTTRSAMAVAMALVPTNPEVFGVALYSFWWTTLWPVIVLGWKRDLWGLRAPLLVIGTLSSPAGGAVFVIFGLAYLLGRRIRDLVSAGILLAGFIFQSIRALDSERAELLSRDADPIQVLEQTARTGGLFETRWLSPGDLDRFFLILAGLAFLSFLVVAAVRLAVVAGRYEPVLLVAAAGVLTVLSAVPAPLISDPAGGGPRYFVLPFVGFAWSLIVMWRYTELVPVRIATGLLLVVSLLGLATTFSRTPLETAASLSWEQEVRRCAESTEPVAQVPIYFDGATKIFWTLSMTPEECRRLV